MKKIILFFSIYIFFCISFQVRAQSIFAFNLNDLNFGNVFIGYSAEVKQSDQNAAKFVFLHLNRKKKNILVNFSLPSFLTNGQYQIPIIFDKLHSTWSKNNRIQGRKNFNPFVPLYIKKIKRFKPVFIWLGGILNPVSGVSPGKYTGTIILTLEIL